MRVPMVDKFWWEGLLVQDMACKLVLRRIEELVGEGAINTDFADALHVMLTCPTLGALKGNMGVH